VSSRVARMATRQEAVVVADCALHRARVDEKQLCQVLAACQRWPGSDRARTVVDLTDERAESPLETLGRLLILERGFPAPVPQLPIWDDDGIVAYVDLGWPEQKVVVEFDGMLKYDGRSPDALRVEKLRQERIERLGWIVVRLTWHDVVRAPDQAAARLRDAFVRAAR
jgi:hypothetical protein